MAFRVYPAHEYRSRNAPHLCQRVAVFLHLINNLTVFLPKRCLAAKDAREIRLQIDPDAASQRMLLIGCLRI